MNAPCYKCENRNPPCHDNCEKYKDFRKQVDTINANRRVFDYGRSVIIECSMRQQLSRMK